MTKTIIKLRKDGLAVFLDSDTQLNEIRLHEPDKLKVILAIALRRAQQIALNYACKHAPEVLPRLEAMVFEKKKIVRNEAPHSEIKEFVEKYGDFKGE